MLEKNPVNRNLSKDRVGKLADAIRRGEWVLNGDAIRISSMGNLLDGQHRLAAIVRSGISCRSVIVTGLPESVFYTIDIGGKARGPADVLSIEKEKNAVTVAACCQLVFRYLNTGNPIGGNSSNAPTIAQIKTVLAENPEIRYAAGSVARDFCRTYVTRSVAAFCFFVFSKTNREKTEEFFGLLETGAGLGERSPVLHLRNRLMDGSGKTAGMDRGYKIALIFKAFKMFLRGDTAHAGGFRVRTEGPCAEKDIYKI